MWAIKVLNGDKRGKLFPLSSGKNTVGRSHLCDVVIDSSGISKEHAEVWIDNGEITISDKQSSNGTYVNGIQIKKQEIESGDQIAFHDIFIDIVPYQARQIVPVQKHPAHSYNHAQMQPNQAMENFSDQNAAEVKPQQKSKNLLEWWSYYLEEVILPGVYKIPTWIELKWVMGIFAITFILTVTVLSVIPLTRILESSIEQEGMSHAKSMALAIARENKKALSSGTYATLSVDFAQRRPGVKQALILRAADGRILAPTNKINTYPKEPAIHRIRTTGRAETQKLGSSSVLSMVPIQYFNPETGSQDVRAYSAVLYDLGILSSNKEQKISLLVQSFFIASILGSLLFFFIYRIFIYPFISINEQLNLALKDQSQTISSDYQLEPLQKLCSNINSALERMSFIQDEVEAVASLDRSTEMSNLVELVGFPCLAIDVESLNILAINQQFEDQTGLSVEQLLNASLEDISDMSLQLNLKSAVENVNQNPSQIHTDQLEFNSHPFQVTASGVLGSKQLAYILVSFIPMSEEEVA